MRCVSLLTFALSSVEISLAEDQFRGVRELQEAEAEFLWDNLFDSRCSDYERNGWCANGQFTVSGEPMGAPSATGHQKCADLGDADCARLYNYPALTCSVCGANVVVAPPSVIVPNPTPAPAATTPAPTPATTPAPFATGAGAGAGATIRCASPGAASCWRLRALETSPDGWGWDMADVEFYSDRGCTQRLTTSTAVSSGHERIERYNAMRAFDGEQSTLWGGRKSAQQELWIGAELTEMSSVSCIRFRQVADPPEPQGRWVPNEGPCTVDSRGCGTSVNHPGNHGNSEECEMTPPAGEPIVVMSFATESGFDFLTVNSRIYEGTSGPEGIVPQGRVHWDTDGSVATAGFRLCTRKGWPQTVTSNEALRVDKYMDGNWREAPWEAQGGVNDAWSTVLINGPEGETADYPASEGCPVGMISAVINTPQCAAEAQPTAAPQLGRSNSFSLTLRPSAARALLLVLLAFRSAY